MSPAVHAAGLGGGDSAVGTAHAHSPQAGLAAWAAQVQGCGAGRGGPQGCCAMASGVLQAPAGVASGPWTASLGAPHAPPHALPAHQRTQRSLEPRQAPTQALRPLSRRWPRLSAAPRTRPRHARRSAAARPTCAEAASAAPPVTSAPARTRAPALDLACPTACGCRARRSLLVPAARSCRSSPRVAKGEQPRRPLHRGTRPVRQPPYPTAPRCWRPRLPRRARSSASSGCCRGWSGCGWRRRRGCRATRRSSAQRLAAACMARPAHCGRRPGMRAQDSAAQRSIVASCPPSRPYMPPMHAPPTRLLHRHPTPPPTQSNRAGSMQEAIDHYTRSTALHTDDARPLNNRAAALIKLRRWSDALVDAEAALVLEPGNGKAQLRRAEALRRMGHAADALQVRMRPHGVHGGHIWGSMGCRQDMQQWPGLILCIFRPCRPSPSWMRRPPAARTCLTCAGRSWRLSAQAPLPARAPCTP